MYSRESVVPRMGPWGIPAVTRYSCEDVPFRTTQSCLLLRKEEIRSNIWPEILKDLHLWRQSACQTLLKALNISSGTAPVAPDLLKVLAILSDTTVRISAVDQKDLKPYWKSAKKKHFSWRSKIQLFNRVINFSRRPFPNINKYRDHQWDLPTVWKTRLFQTDIDKFS